MELTFHHYYEKKVLGFMKGYFFDIEHPPRTCIPVFNFSSSAIWICRVLSHVNIVCDGMHNSILSSIAKYEKKSTIYLRSLVPWIDYGV
ncbi:hypothetical protein Bca4012_009500 [Brassica carinata]